MTATVKITYEVTIPDEWDTDLFATHTAMDLADAISDALHDHPEKAVTWAGSAIEEVLA